MRARNQRPGRRVVDDEQLRQLVADPLGAHDLEPARGARSTAATQLGHRLEPEAGDEARRPQHPQRVVGERDVGRERRAQPAARRGRRAPSNGSTSSGSGRRSAIAFTVKSRRERSVSMSSPNDDLGLAALRVVHVGAERRDLARHAVDDRADRPEPLALRATTPSARSAASSASIASGRASVAKSNSASRRSRSRSASRTRPADEVALVARVGRARAATCCAGESGREQRREPRRDVGHRASLVARTRARRIRSTQRSAQVGWRRLAPRRRLGLGASARVSSRWSSLRRRSCGFVAVASASRRVTMPCS